MELRLGLRVLPVGYRAETFESMVQASESRGMSLWGR